MIEERIGKIKSVKFGFGGYDDTQFGLGVSLGSDKDSWGVGSFDGYWSMKPTTNAQWNIEDQDAGFALTCRNIMALLKDAKITDVSDLAGVPVSVTFEGNVLKSWRILTEAL